jgi:predicted  nucleic acid-binding Zn-ribbon protein
MKMTKSNWVALAAAVVLLALLAAGATTVFATGNNSAGNRVIQVQGLGKNIDVARQRIDRAIQKLTRMKAARLAAFNMAKAQLDKAITNFALKGLDVSKLKSDVEALVSMVDAASAKCDEVIAALRNAKAQDTIEKLKEQAREALGRVRELRRDMQSIRGFVKTVIKADIKDLRSLLNQGTRPPK